jgi:hypothetical protein
MTDKQPPWLSDWRGVAGYPDPDSPRGTSSRHRWRWEFLRRDPAYQHAWAESRDRPARFWHERYWLRYWLTDPVDPASPKAFFTTPRRYWFIPARGENQNQTAHLEVKQEIIQRAGTALVEFDLTRPLQPQIESVGWHLQAWVEERHRRGKGFQWRPKDWLRYLRLLDADASGAPKDEIVGVLYPTLTNEFPERQQDTHLRDDRRAALNLRDGGYARF